MLKKMSFRAAMVLAAAWSGAASGGVLYVDRTAPAGGTGASWSSAFNDLSVALVVAQPGTEVRVAQGQYRPGGPGSPRTASFMLKTGVTLRGGYAGQGAANPDQRDPAIFVTTLSGDLNGDDAPGFVNRAENSYNVVLAAALTGEATLDGVRIVGGNADGPLTASVMQDRGGGVLARSAPGAAAVAALRIVGCTLEDNTAKTGGGAAVDACGVRVDRSRFLNNRAIGTPAGGGGFGVNSAGVAPVRYEFARSVFAGNTAALFGGAIVTFGVGYTLTLSGCVFDGNSAPGGGGIYTTGGNNFASAMNCVFLRNTSSSAPAWFDDNTTTLRIAHCTATRNTATGSANVGSVFRFLGLDARLSNAVVRGNSTTGATLTDLGGNLSVRFSNIEGGAAGPGNIDSDALFRDALAGDLRLRRGSPCVDSGSNADVLPDVFDLDGDSNVLEPTPMDLAGLSRFMDDPASAPNSGAPQVDMGALERHPCPGDANDDLVVTFTDLNIVLSQFGQSGPIGALMGDLTGDGAVTFADLNVVLGVIGSGCP